jgi:hypothetical protein
MWSSKFSVFVSGVDTSHIFLRSPQSLFACSATIILGMLGRVSFSHQDVPRILARGFLLLCHRLALLVPLVDAGHFYGVYTWRYFRLKRMRSYSSRILGFVLFCSRDMISLLRRSGFEMMPTCLLSASTWHIFDTALCSTTKSSWDSFRLHLSRRPL